MQRKYLEEYWRSHSQWP